MLKIYAYAQPHSQFKSSGQIINIHLLNNKTKIQIVIYGICIHFSKGSVHEILKQIYLILGFTL